MTDLDDHENQYRVKVEFPWLSDDVSGVWARVVVPMAGDQRGTWFMPEVGDEVLVAFERGELDRPFLIGRVYDGDDDEE